MKKSSEIWPKCPVRIVVWVEGKTGGRKIRAAWDEEREEWYFSVVNVIAVLTDQPTARNASTYWAVLKKRLKEEGASELLTNCKQLKMRATDGKMRLTDVANTEQILRIIQSIPSPKAEPFKRWLAQVGLSVPALPNL